MCCEDIQVYKSVERDGWHLIDLKSFEVMTPKEYKFSPKQGIDSSVGEISNGKVQISFDYGCYSHPGPRDIKETIERNSDYVNLSTYAMHLQDLLDVSSYEKDGRVNLTELLGDLHNVQLLKYSDSVQLSVQTPENLEYYYQFQFNGETYRIPFEFDDDSDENEDRFEFMRDTSDNIYRKIYFDKVLSDTMKYGVFMVDLSDFNEARNAHCKKLGLVASGVSAQEFNTVKKIIDSIQFR